MPWATRYSMMKWPSTLAAEEDHEEGVVLAGTGPVSVQSIERAGGSVGGRAAARAAPQPRRCGDPARWAAGPDRQSHIRLRVADRSDAGQGAGRAHLWP